MPESRSIPCSGYSRDSRPPDLSKPGAACDLCGLPLGRSRLSLKFQGRIVWFCCPGCRAVYQVLANSPDGPPADFRGTAIYKAGVESGIIPRAARDLDKEASPAGEKQGEIPRSALSLVLKIEGMWCPACSWLIEAVLRKTLGMLEAKVLFASDLAQIQYLPYLITPKEILSKISGLGYRASFFEERREQAEERRKLLLRLGVSAILTFNMMMMAFALYYGFFEDLTPQGVRFLSWPLWAMATAVVFYGGWPMLRKGLSGLRYGAPSMETLISVGSLAAYAYSLFHMFQNSLHLYFDTASMLVTLVLTGKYIEMHARQKVSGGILELYELAHQKVRLCQGPPPPAPLKGDNPAVATGEAQVPSVPFLGKEGEQERETWVSSREVRPGEKFLVVSGERIPLDGCVLSGQGNVDEAILTGESRPLRKKAGDEVMGGSLLLDGELTLKTTRVGGESTLGQMIALLQEGLDRKNPAEVLADRITRWFVPAIFLLAAVTGIILWLGGSSGEEVLLRALTLLVISCPCALGIAMPLVKIAAVGLGRRRGILVRDLSALENARDLRTLIFDKTGTLTEGTFRLQQVVSADGCDEIHLAKIAAVERHSSHFLAKAVVRRAEEAGLETPDVSRFEEFEGLGVKGDVGEETIRIGSRQFMEQSGLEIPSRWEEQGETFENSGKTVIFFGTGRRVRGIAVFSDTLRRGTREMIHALHIRGIKTLVVSGDAAKTTKAFAEEAGILSHQGRTLPSGKVRLVKELQQNESKIGMVGDGINDAAALAQADVGFAFGGGGNLAREAADVVILSPEPSLILTVLDLSALTCRVLRQNLFFAFLYNGLAVPLAATGWLNPLIAVFAMFASSLTVIGNALRISRLPYIRS